MKKNVRIVFGDVYAHPTQSQFFETVAGYFVLPTAHLQEYYLIDSSALKILDF